MAAFQRLLGRKGSSASFGGRNSSELNTEWKAPNFDPNRIRLVIYQDNERDRTLLFDSKAVKLVEEPQPKCYSGIKLKFGCSGKAIYDKESCGKQMPKFMFSKPGSDVQMLEEIMFGCVGIAYTGTSLKVHLTKSPPQLMLTKVFIPESPKRESLGSDMDSFSLQSHSDPLDPKPICSDLSEPKQISSSVASGNNVAQSVPVDVPSPRQSKRPSFDIIDEDSGLASLTSSGSFHTPFPSPGSNASSYNSLHRRWMRVQYTSLESGLKKRNSQDNLQAQDSTPSSSSSSSCRKKSKIALGIIFGLNENTNDEDSNKLFENFFFSHITLFEGHLDKLKSGVERAYYNRRKFVQIVMEALQSFRKEVADLYTAPRLCNPVWLNMMSHSNYRYHLCENFMEQFMILVQKYDSKNFRFFISTLVTAVLTHHLAWVPTVTPVGGTSSKTYLRNHTPNWVDTFAKTHPYNPLWAQLGDLYGAIGFPLKLARTVVVGKKADLVKKILYVLSYFIRCSDVHENEELGSLKCCLDDLSFDSQMDSERPGYFHMNNSQPSETSSAFSNENEITFKDESFSINDSQLGSFINSTHSNQNYENSELDLELNAINTAHDLELKRLREIRQREKDCQVIQLQQQHYENSLGDEGYCSILPEDETSLPQKSCRLSQVSIIEKVPVEHVQMVCKAPVGTHGLTEVPTPSVYRKENLKINDYPGLDNSSNSCKVACSPPGTPRSCSRLSQQLEEDCVSKNATDNIVASKSEVKAHFLKGASHSMFNEYFDDASIMTKTIDQVDEKDRVIKHPLMLSSDSVKSSTDSIIHELAGSMSSQSSDLPGTHELRLGSFSGVRPRISSVSRQLSSDRGHITGRPTTLPPGRCRSVTPTELSRRRHLSSTSSNVDVDFADPMVGFSELKMPVFSGDLNSNSIKVFDRNFGRSLLAGYSDHYLSDFVLHGTSETNFQDKLKQDLLVSIQHSVLDEPIGEATCVIADTDKFTVDVASSQCVDKMKPVIASQLVCNLIEGLLQLWKLKMSPEFCLMHLEDRLQEIFFKSKMLAEYLKDVKKCNMKELTQLLGFEAGDLPLLVAIAGTHSPHLSLGVI